MPVKCHVKYRCLNQIDKFQKKHTILKLSELRHKCYNLSPELSTLFEGHYKYYQ